MDLLARMIAGHLENGLAPITNNMGTTEQIADAITNSKIDLDQVFLRCQTQMDRHLRKYGYVHCKCPEEH